MPRAQNPCEEAFVKSVCQSSRQSAWDECCMCGGAGDKRAWERKAQLFCFKEMEHIYTTVCQLS
jgi:hypothetical protein